MSKDKGTRFERWVAKELGGERVLFSGALKHLGEEFTGDVKAKGYTIECKVRKSGFKQLYTWLEKDEVDMLAIKEDYKKPLVVMPWKTLKQLLNKIED